MSDEQLTRQTEVIKSDLRNISSTREVRSYDDNSIEVTFKCYEELKQPFSNGMLQRGYVAAKTEIVEVNPHINMSNSNNDDTVKCIKVVYKRITDI